MIDKSGHIKLTDFGLSELETVKKLENINNSQKVFGTANYLAPELIKQTGNSKAVDFWALGNIICLHRCYYI